MYNSNTIIKLLGVTYDDIVMNDGDDDVVGTVDDDDDDNDASVVVVVAVVDRLRRNMLFQKSVAIVRPG